jgi:hypothetical protein
MARACADCTNLAMILNTARFSIPADGKRLPRFPE